MFSKCNTEVKDLSIEIHSVKTLCNSQVLQELCV